MQKHKQSKEEWQVLLSTFNLMEFIEVALNRYENDIFEIAKFIETKFLDTKELNKTRQEIIINYFS